MLAALPNGCSSEACVEAPPILAACVEGPDSAGLRGVTSFEGTVEEIGVYGDNGCFGSPAGAIGPRFGFSAADYEQAHWIGVRTDDGDLFRVGIMAPEFVWAASEGQHVAFDLRSGAGWEFAPEQSDLLVRGPANELLFWMGVSGSAEELTPPPDLAVADGGTACRRSSGCIDEWEQRDMRVTVDEDVRIVGYGSKATLASVTFVNGGLDVQTGGSQCSDAFVARAVASAWHAPREP